MRIVAQHEGAKALPGVASCYIALLPGVAGVILGADTDERASRHPDSQPSSVPTLRRARASLYIEDKRSVASA